MRIYVGVTDNRWFAYLRSLAAYLASPAAQRTLPNLFAATSATLELSGPLDEVNFWQPSPDAHFRALQRGDLFLFKLHRSPETQGLDLIAGGGVFFSYSELLVSLAWEAFGPKNGASSFSELRQHIAQYRRQDESVFEDFKIGCIVLTQPFFFDESNWFAVPEWHQAIVRGKTYSLDTQAGQKIWRYLSQIWENQRLFDLVQEARRVEEEHARFGKETTIRPRLGQGSFKVAVTDAYNRACAITQERALPALEAGHIKSYSEGGPHKISNGLLLRSDFHRLFDKGYITVTPDYHIEVSRRIREEFDNGRYYLKFQGKKIRPPLSVADRPASEFLIWHNENRFKA